MKRSLKTLKGYSLEATDGPKGKVKDFLFDEEGWIIRYLEADYGSFLAGKRVLIPRTFLDEPNWNKEEFYVQLAREDIERCPELLEKKPVSREYETELSKHYGISLYWPVGYTTAPGVLYPPRPVTVPGKVVSEEDVDTSLRSFREVKGYHIRANDGKLGHVEDIIVDDQDWQIIYLIADTKNLLPWSKRVIIPIDRLHGISYTEHEVQINLQVEDIKAAPEYDAKRPVEIDFEKKIYEFYDRHNTRNSSAG